MQTKQYMEYRLECVMETEGGTERWQRTGIGDGQEAYSKEKTKWPQAELTLFVRQVVVTTSAWKNTMPDEACSGSGYAHQPHGRCLGYATDRT